MQRRPAARAHVLAALCALVVSLAVALAMFAAALPGTALAAAGTTLYGQVVDVGANAIVLSLQNSDEWVAVNVTGQTVISSQSGGPPSIQGIEDGDWALVAYRTSRQHQGGTVATWLVATSITYSSSPVSTAAAQVHVVGHVTALTPNGFTLLANNGTAWSVSVVAGATSVLVGGAAAALSFLQVGDPVQVWGTAAGNAIVATRIVYRIASRTTPRPRGPRGHGRS